MTSTLVPALASGGFVGFSLGLVGGGSILATPLLLYVVGVADPHVAIGSGALAVSINAYAKRSGCVIPRVSRSQRSGPRSQ
jgi:uncharacterized membrane protein YfcA